MNISVGGAGNRFRLLGITWLYLDFQRWRPDKGPYGRAMLRRLLPSHVFHEVEIGTNRWLHSNHHVLCRI